MSEHMPLVDDAVRYAQLGYRIFPCRAGSKKPCTRNGFKDATRDEDLIRAWWAEWPAALIATPDTCTVDIEAPKPARNGGPDGPNGWLAWHALTAEHGEPDAPTTQTGLYNGIRGAQLHFAYCDLKTGSFAEGIEVRAAGSYVLLPPSAHTTGVRYEGELPPIGELPELPEWIADLRRGRKPGTRSSKEPTPAEKLPPVIRDGNWHTTMVSAAGTLRRRGFSEPAALAALIAENGEKYTGTIPADSDAEIAELVADVYERYDAVETIEVERAYNGTPRALADVVDTFQRHLHLPDPTPVHVVLATVIANRIPEGDPVWVVIVAGSSRGKTELLLAVEGLERVRIVGALTVASLLSGTARKDRRKDASGGVLAEIGSDGLIVVKDMGAILSLHRDTRAQVLQALRDVYDGLYTRDVGADGGTKLEWRGRVGLLAGATSALDQAHAVLSVLGERWLTLRLPPGNEAGMAKLTMRGVDTAGMRAELREAAHGFLATFEPPPMRLLSPEEEDMLASLAVLVCFARSPVERERDYKREIVLVHQAEGPGRITRQLHKLYVALEAIGVDAASTLVRVGLDSIPAPRREVLLHLLEHGGELAASKVARALRLPTVSARRALEELAAHNLLSFRKDGDAENAAILWKASPSARELWEHLAAIALVERG